MTDTSRVRLSVVRETTIGTTPGSPRMRTARVSGINLRHEAEYVMAGELRDDRMDADPVTTGDANDGTISYELHFPRDLSPLSEWFQSLFNNAWQRTPGHENDGTADTSITGVGSTTGVYTVIDESGSGGFAGTAYVARHLVWANGFSNAANNMIGRVTASNATSITLSPTTTVQELVPPGTARLKVVGFEGASGDITATATGLASTLLDFTTLGLVVGQWIKIGGTGATFRFATEALNGYARITAITATALTLDHRPAGWGTDAGTTRTIRVWFGDVLRNGTTKRAVSMEQGYMGQAVPTYILQAGMHAVTGELTFSANSKITGSFGFEGLSGVESSTSVDASPDASLDVAAFPIFATGANVGRVAEAGAPLVSPNFVRSARWSWTNNARSQRAIDVQGAAGVGMGRAGLSIALETYFGSTALLTKANAGTPTSLAQVLVKGAQAMVFTAPRLTLRGFPTAPGPDQDSMLSLTGMPSRDTLTGCHYQLDRLEYTEA
jgi:hypothetical protein